VDERRELIALAAEMARGTGMPSNFAEDRKFYLTTPKAERRRILAEAERALETARVWAIRVRRVADRMAEAGTGYSQQTMDAMVKEREHAAHAQRLAEAALLQSVALRREMASLDEAGTGYSQQTMDAAVKERDGLQSALLMERGKTEAADADNQRLRDALTEALAEKAAAERGHDAAHAACVKYDRELAEARSALQELRIRLHAAGRRPEECYEMSLIDATLAATPSPSAPAEVPACCHWRQDADGSEWDTDCGLSWCFEDGGPTENGGKFCTGCGKPLVAIPYVEPPICEECGAELTAAGQCRECPTTTPSPSAPPPVPDTAPPR
jgi:uncharacterized protein YaiI (UPF0178 family)